MRLVLTLALATILAGCASPGTADHGAALDTGLIDPDGEATLSFASAGTYELHCDPHPFMLHDVTVEAGAPMAAHVHILDGNATSEYRFDPQVLHVAPGASVTYHNHGTLPHTASQMTESMQH